MDHPPVPGPSPLSTSFITPLYRAFIVPNTTLPLIKSPCIGVSYYVDYGVAPWSTVDSDNVCGYEEHMYWE